MPTLIRVGKFSTRRRITTKITLSGHGIVTDRTTEMYISPRQGLQYIAITVFDQFLVKER